MDPIRNSLASLRLAQAYGIRPVRAVQPVQPANAAEFAQSATDAARSSPASHRSGSDTVELSANAAARQRIASLVAARVPGSIDFTLTNEGVMAPGEAGAMKLHRHPADLNSAATGVALGRAIDFEA